MLAVAKAALLLLVFSLLFADRRGDRRLNAIATDLLFLTVAAALAVGLSG